MDLYELFMGGKALRCFADTCWVNFQDAVVGFATHSAEEATIVFTKERVKLITPRESFTAIRFTGCHKICGSEQSCLVQRRLSPSFIYTYSHEGCLFLMIGESLVMIFGATIRDSVRFLKLNA